MCEMKIGGLMNKHEFALLAALEKGAVSSPRELAQLAGVSLGTTNATLRELVAAGLAVMGEEGAEGSAIAITEAGLGALSPYKVDNAIIMAAGLSSRFAPISYERPKGVLTVRGEVLIERQIKQLQEAGITDITVVVGYMKEEFFYLEDLLGVRISVNNEYTERNNNSTIRRIADRLGNTYICSSDDYFTENPFERYVFGSYYSAVYVEGETDEYCLITKGKDALIADVVVGGSDSWVMLGHAYWDRSFSKRFVEILDSIYDDPSTASKLWEDIYIDHIDELPMIKREYEADVIWEFDSLDELRVFDPYFIDNVDSSIMDNICRVLGCERRDITGINPIKQGLTNLSFRFDVGGKSYVYRHPGFGTSEIISRKSEAMSQRVAAKLGIDGTFIYEDECEGWKISHYVENAKPLDYHNEEHVKLAMGMARKLHESGADTGYVFDIHEDTKKQIALLDERRRASFRDFRELYELADSLNDKVKADGLPPVLCHNDLYDPNFLIAGDEIHLIDWEYSGMSDYASDLGVFIACSDYSYEEAMHVLEVYFGRELTPGELFHCVAYISVVSFHWFVWALYQDMCGSPVGEYLHLYYKYTKMYGKAAVKMAEELGR